MNVFKKGDEVSVHGKQGVIEQFAVDNKSAQVSFPHTPGARTDWFALEQLEILPPRVPVLTSPPPPLSASREDELYPVGTMLVKRSTGESAEVIERWQQDVKLKCGDGIFILQASEVEAWVNEPPSLSTTRDVWRAPTEHEYKALQIDNTLLKRQVESMSLDLTLLHRALDAAKIGDKFALVEENGKLRAETIDALKRARDLEHKLGQQAKMLTQAVKEQSSPPAPLRMEEGHRLAPAINDEYTENWRDSHLLARLTKIEALVGEHEDYIEQQVQYNMDEAERIAEEMTSQPSPLTTLPVGEGNSGRIEIKTLLQNLTHDSWIDDEDDELAVNLNSGWEILHIQTTSSVNHDANSLVIHTRIVTLKRTCSNAPVTIENVHYQASPETPDQTLDSFADLLNRADVSAEEVITAGDAQVMNAARSAFDARMEEIVHIYSPRGDSRFLSTPIVIEEVQ